MNYTSYILAFQFCIILGSYGCYCQDTLTRETEHLKAYLKANTSDVANGGPLFLNILRNWKEESDNKIIQSQIVSFYFKLFDNLKDHEVIKKSMESIKEDIFVKFFNSNLTKMDDFQNLTRISVDDQLVQRKAVSELFNVLNFLSPKSNLKKRKRSQTLFRGRRASKY
ncbi:interferon gamma [Lepus europaeus]|uniref:interferon gamma n=1 Tax=Lepus europaeus TaxID=9983 RepID=UPI002B47840A|nr:interferon gamma [Lepus europaeus]